MTAAAASDADAASRYFTYEGAQNADTTAGAATSGSSTPAHAKN